MYQDKTGSVYTFFLPANKQSFAGLMEALRLFVHSLSLPLVKHVTDLTVKYTDDEGLPLAFLLRHRVVGWLVLVSSFFLSFFLTLASVALLFCSVSPLLFCSVLSLLQGDLISLKNQDDYEAVLSLSLGKELKLSVYPIFLTSASVSASSSSSSPSSRSASSSSLTLENAPSAVVLASHPSVVLSALLTHIKKYRASKQKKLELKEEHAVAEFLNGNKAWDDITFEEVTSTLDTLSSFGFSDWSGASLHPGLSCLALSFSPYICFFFFCSALNTKLLANYKGDINSVVADLLFRTKVSVLRCVSLSRSFSSFFSVAGFDLFGFLSSRSRSVLPCSLLLFSSLLFHLSARSQIHDLKLLASVTIQCLY
jgi:hypothetical protein